MVERENGWQLAEHLDDARPWRTQGVLSHVLLDKEAASDLCRDCTVEHLGAEDAVLVVDETGFPVKDRHSAGVTRQYSDAAGRIENSRVGVFLAYAGRERHTLIGRLPSDGPGWMSARDRAEAAG